uniref:UBA domain-containing protein n=1 Tax=Salvator merianae TaxID=96440 RepID=A0A8D0DKW7_SALMN
MVTPFFSLFSLPRTENSDKETTSLEMPSLPTLDGIKGPVRFPEISPKTGDPASCFLDRSVSAPSLCTREGSQAESTNRRAAKSVESLLERPMTLGGKETPLSPLNLPDHVTSAGAAVGKTGIDFCPSPAVNSQNAFAKPVSQAHPQKPSAEDGARGLEPHAGSGGSCSLSALGPAEDMEVPSLSGHLEWGRSCELHLDLKACGKPGNKSSPEEQNEVEPFSPLGRSSGLANGKQDPANSVAAGTKSAEGELGFLSEETRLLACSLSKHLRGEAFMEVDVPGKTSRAAGDPSGEGNFGAASVRSGCSVAEVDSSRCPPPSPVSSPSTSGMERSGSASVGLMDAPVAASCAQQAEQGEDPSLSLASALKELHQLLVVSCKGDVKVSQQEEKEQLVAISGEQSVIQEMFKEELECQYLDSQEMKLSFPQCEAAEAGAPGRPASGGQEVHTAAARRERAALGIQESSSAGSQCFLNPLAASGPLQDEEGSQSGQVQGDDALKQRRPPCLELARGQALGPCPGGTGTPGASELDTQRCPVGPPELPPALAPGFSDPAASRRLVSTAADIDHIVGAGFTPQEAGEALERAGGDPDLALLILLAKNIIVPT